MDDLVYAQVYNHKEPWMSGKIINKFGRLHYQVQLTNGYQFKRHIDQLILRPNNKTVTFAEQPNRLYLPSDLSATKMYVQGEL